MNHSRNATISSLSLLLSSSAFAQFTASVSELNAIYDPPANIELTLCRDFNGTSDELGENSACKDGVGAADWMAKKYAVNAGKYMGCVDGFSKGFSNAFRLAKNPTSDMTKTAQASYAALEPVNAINRGEARANDQAQTASANDIVNRYRAVINQRNVDGTQVLPNKSYGNWLVDRNGNKISFEGFDDGYQTDVLPTLNGFNDVKRAGWINEKTPFEDQVAAQKLYELQQQGTNPCPAPGETIFGRKSVKVMTIWDLFRAQDQINFEAFGWRNPQWAWDVYRDFEKNLDRWQAYQNIATRKKVVTVVTPIYEKVLVTDAQGMPVKKLNPDGTPMVDANGKFVFEYENKFVRNDIRKEEQPLTPSEIDRLQKIYQKAFFDAYDMYYARKYASLEYNKEGIAKQEIGRTLGTVVGQSVATAVANKEAYNAQYKLVSSRKFYEQLEKKYKSSFDKLIKIFASNPVYELNSISVFGSFPRDAIFRPEEKLGFNYSITNLGEMPGKSSVNFSSGGLQAIAPAHPINIDPLTRVSDQTNFLAMIPGTVPARQRMSLGVTVANLGNLNEIAKELTVLKNQDIEVNDYAEIDAIEDELDYVNGNVKLTVSVENPSLVNPSELDPPVTFKVATDFGALGQDEVDTINVGPKSKQRVVLELGHIDPLLLISQNSISGTVSAVLGGKTIHTQKISVTTPRDKDLALVNYFDALVTGRSTNSGRESKDNRIAKLGTMISQLLGSQIEDINILWKRDAGRRAYDLSVVYQLVQKYQESKRANRLSEESQMHYEALVQSLIKDNIRKIRAGGGLRFFFGPNRRNFLYRLQEIAPKISHRPRDHY